LMRAARRVGADVPVCLDPRPRRMRGIGERLSEPLAVPPLPAVLVNPGVALPTKDVFKALGLAPGQQSKRMERAARLPSDPEAFVGWLAASANDLEPAAVELRPEIARALAALRRMPGCELARMSGSGATCFGLFATSRAAAAAAKQLASAHPRWWVRATVLG
jgi:4-diphosphocytidyl-2-C-methyl-D-erythritol kinase